jgi:hypothetical protein
LSQFATKTLVPLNKKCIFKHYTEFQARKSLLVGIIFTMKKNSVDLFRAAPYVLMLLLHKDVLFHCLLRPIFFNLSNFFQVSPETKREEYSAHSKALALLLAFPTHIIGLDKKLVSSKHFS